MLYYILLDLNLQAWEMTEDDPLNNIQVFIHACVLMKYGNIVKIINNRKVIYDSSKNTNFDKIFESLLNKKDPSSGIVIDDNTPQNQDEYKSLAPGDLGLALMDSPDEVLIYDMSNEKPSEYLEYLKCMFVAQSRKIKINGYSLRNNMLVKMCVEGSKGKWLETCSLGSLLGLLGLPKAEKEAYEISCNCCNKRINLAMVCPICLAVYCKFVPVCKRCKTKFSFK